MKQTQMEKPKKLLNSHRKGVNVLVELVQNGNRLDNHVVGTMNVELDFRARIAVPETNLFRVEPKIRC